jgi:hypothetical protein
MLMRRGIVIVAAAAIGVAVAAGACGCSIRPSGPGGSAASNPAASNRAPATSSPPPAPASVIATVKATFTAAITAVASFGSPPAAYEMTVMSAISMRKTVPGFSATLVSDLRASGLAEIIRYFSPPQAAAERTALASAMAFDADPFIINLGSGVTRISFGGVEVKGGVSTVRAQVAVWSKSVEQQPLTGIWLTDAPVRAIGYTAVLHLDLGGSWQVVSLTAH